MTPTLHMSKDLLYPLLRKTSGAISLKNKYTLKFKQQMKCNSTPQF